jgi:Zn-dependent protease with chaperone function
MQFTQKSPDEGVNYSRENPLREALVLVAIVAAIGAAVLLAASWFVEEIVVRIPPAWESRVFGYVAQEFPAHDDARQERVAEILNALDPATAANLTVRVLEDEQLNAFAAPGGLIMVTTGLLNSVESENELAFVLGHEMGHFRNRDHLRSMGRGLASSLTLGALSAVVGADVSSLGWLHQLTQLRFSRGQEREADVWGLELTAKRYGHVGGATAFFERLPQAQSALARGAESFLSSHPVTVDRIRRLGRLAEQEGWRSDGPLTAFP